MAGERESEDPAVTYLTPGVYIEEMPSGAMPLAAAATAIAAFIGFTAEAPPDQAAVDPLGESQRLVTSWAEYTRLYGGFTDEALLPQAVYGYFQNGGGPCYIVRINERPLEQVALALAGGVPQAGELGDVLADDVTMVMVPDLLTAASKDQASGACDKELWIDVQQALVTYCEAAGNCMAILDPPPDLDPEEVRQWRDLTNLDSGSATLYYPWLGVDSPAGSNANSNTSINVPPCGHVAGIWARTDTTRGVWKAPANEAVRSILSVSHDVTELEQELLNPVGINAIRSFGSRGIKVWGARTLSTTDPSWTYISVRRLLNMIETTIKDGTQWVVFEPNDQVLWERVTRTVNAFLLGLWRAGAFFGASSAEAFSVKCDAENNPQESRDEGKLTIEVAVAPVRPAEFVILRICQQIQTS